MRRVPAWRSRASAAGFALAIAAAAGASDVRAQEFELLLYIYAMPGGTPVQCAVTPDPYNPATWQMIGATMIDTSPTGEATLPIGRFLRGTPVTCVISEDSVISGIAQPLAVTWQGYRCTAAAQGNWSRIAIIAKGPGCN